MWTQNDVKSQKNIISLFLHRTETLYSHHKVPYVHCDISMATQLAPGPLHLRVKSVFLLQELLFALAIHSVGLSEYEHYTTQAKERPLDSRATNKPFFHFRKEEVW